MNNKRVAASTGEIDKRCINGNNGTRRGKDKKQRKIPPKWRLKPEVRAGLKARFDIVIDHFGGFSEMAKALKVDVCRLTNAYRLRGMIPPEVARRVHYHHKRMDLLDTLQHFAVQILSLTITESPLL
ncbi:transcriptional regulator [Citrobacter phage HCF1]|uniref:Transcriptional regulator n=2 Tax=Drexlerviridae TaxID=2731691 RepID=A0A6M5CDN6_9CAUD|nr:transcriptional regulator [Citrobacter phage HCF1]